MGFFVKAFPGINLIDSKICGKKCSHQNGYCGLDLVGSLGDFDGLIVSYYDYSNHRLNVPVITSLT